MQIRMVGSCIAAALAAASLLAPLAGAQPLDATDGCNVVRQALATSAARVAAASPTQIAAMPGPHRFWAASMQQRHTSLWQTDIRLTADTTVVSGLAIARVEDGGTTIVLQDGTRWDVFLPDRVSTDTWQPGDFVSVRMRPIMEGEGSRYRYELVNGRARSEAAVRFSGVATQQ